MQQRKVHSYKDQIALAQDTGQPIPQLATPRPYVVFYRQRATLGLDGIVVRNIVRDPSCKEEILGTAFVLKLLGGVSTLILAVVAVSLLRPHENLTRWLVGITAAGMNFQAFDVIYCIF